MFGNFNNMSGKQMGGMGLGMLGQALSGQRINPNQFRKPMMNPMMGSQMQGAPSQQVGAPNRMVVDGGMLGQMANQGANRKPLQGGYRAY